MLNNIIIAALIGGGVCFVIGVIVLIIASVLSKKRPQSAKTCMKIAVSMVVIGLVLFIGAVIAGMTNSPSKDEISVPEQTTVDTSVSFDEIYRAYKENELRADDTYQYNRYRITAKINGMETDGLFNLTGGATLTMETQVDNTIVFFYAEFEREQEEALKSVNVGDTITFEGKCLSAGSWTDCEIIEE